MQFFREQSKTLRTALFVVAFLSGVAFGQNESGRINGRASDPNGAVVPGAIVLAKSVETGLERMATTTDEGFYVITNVPPGIYEVTVQAAGFATTAQRVRVFVGSSVRLDIGLTVTPVTVEERVVESASGVEVNTQSGQLSDPITSRQLRELPVITRDPYSLVTLSGNVTPFRINPLGGIPILGSISPVVINTQPDQDFAIDGQNPNFNNVQIDGGENIVNYWSTLGQRVPQSGVQGINVITNGFRPEFGRLGGGLINVATRSGSNDWRGEIFTFYRGDALNSKGFEVNAFGRGAGTHLVGNTPGVAFGGPIIHDKLFFFNGTEGNIVRSREDRIALVPTFGTAATPGLLALSAPATQAFFTAPAGFPPPTTNVLRTLTVGDTLTLLGIPAGGSTPFGLFSALPATTPAFNLVAFNVPTEIGGGFPQDSLFSVTRLDYTLSDRSLIYGRYAFSTRDIFRGALSFSPFFGFNTGVNEQAHNGMINWLQTLSGPNCCSGPGASAWLMNLKAQFSRINLRRSNDVNTIGPRLASAGFAGANIGGVPIGFPGDFPFNPNLNSLITGPLNLFQFAADFAGNWRGHQVQFGWSFFHFQDNRNILSFQDGLFTLGPNVPSALDNLVNGTASSFAVAINPIAGSTTATPLTTTPIGTPIALPVVAPNFNRSIRENDFSAYASFNWRVSPRINLLLGLRYDIFGRPRSRNDQIFFNFIPGTVTTGTTTFVPSTGDLTPGQVATGRLLPTGFDLDDDVVTSLGIDGSNNSFFKGDFNNVAPRIGFAWDIRGHGAGSCCSGPDRRTTLRAGFGTTFERLFYAVSPFFQTRSDFAIASITTTGATATPVLGSIPLSTSNFGPLGGTTGTVPFPGQLVRGIERRLHAPKVWFWDVSLEREIFGNTVAALQYAGSAGRDLFTLPNVNRPGSAAAFLPPTTPPTPPIDPTARLNTGLSPIFFLNSNGRSNYNAFIADFTNNTWRTNGWQFTARYRFSKALDNVSAFTGNNFGVFSGSFAPDLLSPFDPNNDYGPSDFDVRHRFISSATWEVPYDWFGSSGCCGGGAGWKGRLLSGWSLTGIFAFQTGFPLNVFDCSSALTPETPCPRALAAPGVDLGDVRSGQGTSFPSSTIPNLFNFIGGTNFVSTTPSFVFPPFPPNTIGRNFFRGPNFWNIDMGIYKRIRISEFTNVQLRGEFYNIFNHANLFVPNGVDISSTPFVPASKFGRRLIQVGAKFYF
ncbi:MAG TPA: TonB-dependent receptor [Blastocatellia bacterium]|nr:TonB-dependent receptor [Blastocatellia bacterium]